MEENFWEIVERAAAVITIFQATPKFIKIAERLLEKLKKRFKKSKRKLK